MVAINGANNLSGRFRRQLSAARPDFARDVIGELLKADDLDAAAIAQLAAHKHFAGAAKRLSDIVGAASVIGDLFVGGPGLPGRIANALNVMSFITSFGEPITLDVIRGYLKQKKRAPQARLTLALLGEPVASYDELPRRERAGQLLGLLVAARRERSP